jgi:hypothetical protein
LAFILSEFICSLKYDKAISPEHGAIFAEYPSIFFGVYFQRVLHFFWKSECNLTDLPSNG